MRARNFRIATCLFMCLLVVGCDDDDKDEGTATGTDTSTITTTGTDTTTTDTTTTAQGDVFVNGGGTVDGMAVDFVCDGNSEPYEFYSTQKVNPEGGHLLGLACTKNKQGTTYSLNIGVLLDAPKSGTVCVANYWGIQVVNVGGGTFYNCAVDGTDTFLIDVKEYSTDAAGTVTWGGDYQVTGTGMGTDFSVDIAGSFRVVTPAM